MKKCPVCNLDVCSPSGDVASDILFIGSCASEDEIRYGRPFAGQIYPIFKRMLFKIAHIDLTATRQILLWYHAKPTSKKALANDCFAVSKDIVLKEMNGKRFIILVGSDAVREFTGKSVDDLAGLDVTDFVDDSYKTNDQKFFSLPKETSIFRSWGEMEFSLRNLAKCMENRND